MLCLMATMLLQPAHADILNEEVVATADTAVLQQEIDLFTAIQRGAALSVAECEFSENCDAGVNKSEIEQMVGVLESRINALSLRYIDGGETALEEILIGYADIRDTYNQLLEKMNKMPRFEETETVVDALGDDFYTGPVATGAGNTVPDELLRLFQDADEELSDDDVAIDAKPVGAGQ